MTQASDTTRTRPGALALAASGTLFLLYQVLRPYADETTMNGAEAIGSGAWIAAHLAAVAAFTLLAPALLMLRQTLADTAARPLATSALVTTWVGGMLTATYYGAETYGLNAIAQRVTDTGDASLIELFDEVRYVPAAVVVFAAGLLLLAAGAVLAAAAIRRSGVLPRWSGVPLAAGYALLIPQFTAPPAGRIVHGALIAAGSIWIAVELWRLRAPASTPADVPAPEPRRPSVDAV